jgi:RNA polymerase sigma-70 factor, ECF subfamily
MGQTGIITLSSILTADKDEINRDKPDAERVVSELYVKLRPALLSYVFHLVHSNSDAEDLIQLAFIHLFENLNRNVEIQNLRAWLYRVVHNFAINDVKQLSRRETLLQEWLNERETFYESTEEELIKRDQVDKLLAILNEKERFCLMLRSEGLSYNEIAEILEINPSAVSVYLARGLKKFRSKNGEIK